MSDHPSRLRPGRAAKEPPGAAARAPGRLPRWAWALIVLGAWIVVWSFTKGQDTLVLGAREHTDLHNELTEFRDAVLASRDTTRSSSSPTSSASGSPQAVDWLPADDLDPGPPATGAADRLARCPRRRDLGRAGGRRLADRPAGRRVLLLVRPLRLLVGLHRPADRHVRRGQRRRGDRDAAGGAAGHRPASSAASIINTILDIIQTMPTFVYLLPIVLFFGIGASAAVVCTLIYALPPLIRIAGHGIRSVSSTTIEATDSVGQTSWQRLRKVQLPMARKTIVVGLNQTIMAALSMATIAAYVDGPGLGQPVLDGAVQERRRRGLRARAADRGDGDHARPHDHRRERGLREGAPAAGSTVRRRRIVLAATAVPRRRRALGVPHLPVGRRSSPRTSWAHGSPTA